jgi:hypothetical protein
MKEFSDPRMVYCDYDRPTPPSMWELNRVFHILDIRPQYIRFDRTRHGWHVVIRLPRALDKLATVALQAVLGSDPRRETLNLMRALSVKWDAHNSRRWNILFREKLK